jgi:hypothetical protein
MLYAARSDSWYPPLLECFAVVLNVNVAPGLAPDGGGRPDGEGDH